MRSQLNNIPTSYLIAVLIAAVCLGACKPPCTTDFVPLPEGDNANKVDRNLLGAQECQVSCWHGIIPGKTARDEAVEIVASLEFVDRDSIYTSYDCYVGSIGCIRWSTALSDYPYHIGSILTRENVVVLISLELEHELTISELINLYGPPDKVSTTAMPRTRCYLSEILWLDEGIGARPAISSDSKFTQDQRLQRIGYFAPVSTIEDYLLNVSNLTRDDVIQRASDYVDWDDSLLLNQSQD